MTGTADHDQPKHQPPDQPPHASRLRVLLLGVLVVVALAAAVASGVLISSRGTDVLGIRGSAADVQAERDAVMSQTRQFMLRSQTYGPDQLDDQGRLTDYRELVEQVITPKLKASFDKEVTTAEQLVGQAGVSREAEVFSTGVVTLDDDSAIALVAGSFTDTYQARGGEEQAQRPVPFRIQVDLVRTDGRWLVDDFTPVSAAAEEDRP